MDWLSASTAFLLVCLLAGMFAVYLMYKGLMPDDFYFVPPEARPPNPEPMPAPILRDFGSHRNPLDTVPGSCSAKFQQIDERTWQCLLCKLVRFEPVEPKAMQAKSEAS